MSTNIRSIGSDGAVQAPAADRKGGLGPMKLSVYVPMNGYAFLSLLIRAAVYSPLAALFFAPYGSDVVWFAVLCPVLLLAVVMPLRFSFAQAAVDAVQGGPFSVRRALSLSRYGQKLRAGLRHALRLLCWGVPLLLALGGLYYLMVWVNVFAAIRIITAFGEGAASALAAIAGLVSGLFGGDGAQYAFGFREGVYVISGIGALTALVFLWGVWRCSVYRYLWARRAPTGNGEPVRIRAAMRGFGRRRLLAGLYNALLCLPSLLIALITGLKAWSKIVGFVSVAFETKTIQPITVSAGESIWIAAGVILYLLLLPVRRSITAKLVQSIQSFQDKKNDVTAYGAISS